jgi:hypothetical protein
MGRPMLEGLCNLCSVFALALGALLRACVHVSVCVGGGLVFLPTEVAAEGLLRAWWDWRASGRGEPEQAWWGACVLGWMLRHCVGHCQAGSWLVNGSAKAQRFWDECAERMRRLCVCVRVCVCVCVCVCKLVIAQWAEPMLAKGSCCIHVHQGRQRC